MQKEDPWCKIESTNVNIIYRYWKNHLRNQIILQLFWQSLDKKCNEKNVHNKNKHRSENLDFKNMKLLYDCKCDISVTGLNDKEVTNNKSSFLLHQCAEHILYSYTHCFKDISVTKSVIRFKSFEVMISYDIQRMLS